MLAARGEKVGVLQVRLYRPFSAAHFLAALPASVTADCRPRADQGAGGARRAALSRRRHDARRGGRVAARGSSMPRVVGGRYGISSKDFTPAMVKAAFDELAKTDATDAAPHATASPSGSTTTSRTPVSTVDPTFSIERARRHPRRLLWPWCRRHGRRQQEQRQDHRRGRRPLRAGLFRLRLAQIRRADDFAPALRPGPDQGALPDRRSRLRRLSPVRFPRAPGRAAASPRLAASSC